MFLTFRRLVHRPDDAKSVALRLSEFRYEVGMAWTATGTSGACRGWLVDLADRLTDLTCFCPRKPVSTASLAVRHYRDHQRM